MDRARAVVCPVCHGKGCKGCKDRGWVTVYDRIPDKKKNDKYRRGER